MPEGEVKKPSLCKKMFHDFMEYFSSFMGGVLVFMCIYLFFHYETWYERIIYISISISVVCLIIKVMPGRPAD